PSRPNPRSAAAAHQAGRSRVAQQKGIRAMTTGTAKSRPALSPGEVRAYPVLPLRDIVVFPHMIVPLFVGREKSIRALEEVKLNKKVSPEVVSVVQQITDHGKIADTVASHLAVKIADKQGILETTAVSSRLEKVLGLMESEISVLQVEKRIRTRVKRQMEKTQREYYLNEQMKAIQKELGDEEGRDELSELEEKIKKTKLSKEAREKAMHELKKLKQMSP